MTVYISPADYAAYRGVSRVTVYKYIKKGQLKKALKTVGKKIKIHKAKADAELLQTLDRIYNPEEKTSRKNPKQKKHAPPLPPDAPQKIQKGGTQGMTMADAQKLQAQYKAALLKLDYEEKSGKLVNIETVDKDWFDTARLTRDAVLNISDRISSELATISDVHLVNKRMTEELNKALTELKI